MRVLSALVLTHCFGCIIPEDTDDDIVRYKRLTPNRSAIGGSSEILQISSSGRPDLVISADTDDRKKPRCGRGAAVGRTTDNDKQARGPVAMAAVDGNLSCYHQTSGVLETREAGSIYLLPAGRSVSANTRENGTQVGARRISSRYLRPKTKRRPSRVVSRQTTRERRRAPLRSRLHHMLEKRHVETEPCSGGQEVASRKNHADRDYRSYRTPGAKEEGCSEARTLVRVARQDNSEDDGDSAGSVDDEADAEAEADAADWDEWTEWSECSASCGCGRQVRWRHCTKKGCANGLKKAQIRTCHLKDCSNKNLLSWLGIKA